MTDKNKRVATAEDYERMAVKGKKALAEMIEQGSEFPYAETFQDTTEWGFPGRPDWSNPKDGDWRIINTTACGEYIVITEECAGYSQQLGVVDDEDEFEIYYYVNVVPGYRATRLRKIYIDDIKGAEDEFRDLLT